MIRSVRLLLVVLAISFLAYGCVYPAPTWQHPSPGEKAIVNANNQLAIELYQQLGTGGGNLFFSPSSISTALAMAYAGARGETAQQMARTLNLDLPAGEVHRAMGAVMRQTATASAAYELTEANGLWGQRGLGFSAEFVHVLRNDYRADAREVDFSDAERARAAINGWASEQTKKRINDLMPPGSVNGSTRLVLTNAVYFKGKWSRQFLPELTRDEPFHVSAARTVQAPMMHQTEHLRRLHGDGFQAVELPYVGEDLALISILPDRPEGLAAWETSLTAAHLDEWLAALHKAAPTELLVALPRFRITREAELSAVLSKLGMLVAFSRGADFSGMTSQPNGLFLSGVFHKAFVDVNEEGTEAAAATGVAAGTALPLDSVFRADHPFFFVIRDNRTGQLLFMGRVEDPTS